MTDKTIWYNTGDCYRHALVVLGPIEDSDHESIAEQCAADFHSNHDGWECSWPREFTVYADKDGLHVLFKADVDRDIEPVFGARLT